MWRPRFKSRLDRLRRYRHIMAVLMKYGLEEVADALRSRLAARFGEKTAPLYVKKAAEGHSRPARVRFALEELGPTFIKFGQLLSTRPDLLAPEYIRELERLQDQVKPDTFERIRAEVERQLDGKLQDIFETFDPTPLAAGSIAQVHRATIPGGRPVAVKVRRPRIVEIIHAECEVLEELTAILKATIFDHETIDPRQMVKEFVEAVSKETDLANERRNQLRFAKNFADDPTIHVAPVCEQFCAPGVLTMEYIDGIKPVDPDALTERGFDCRLVAKRGADFVMRQIFELGFFHADPHPGNFFLLPDNVLAPIDFGQVSRLSTQDRRLFNDILLAIVDNEAARVVRALGREEMLHEMTNVSQLTAEMEQFLDTYRDLPLRNIPFGPLINQTFDLFRSNHVSPPPQFTLMLKSLVTIEAFARSLNPDFNIMETLR
ncbi:MAG: ABC1 kinase family protein, partial [Planctomycetota bacterium]